MKKHNRIIKRMALMLCIVLLIPNVMACGSRKMESTTGQDGNNNASFVSGKETSSAVERQMNYDTYKMDKEEQESLDFTTEEYHGVEEQRYQSTRNQPLSTFSADVDTASYSNIRRMLNEGRIVDTGAVRIEEMLNYFSYDYKQPEGDSPFGVTTELSDCPWNPDTKLFLLGIQTEKIDFSKSAPANLVFLIDVSGSMMEENKLPLVQSAFLLLVENLTEKDRISIVTYAGDDMVVLSGAKGNQKEKIQIAIEELEAGGGTYGSKGIETAYQIAMENFIEGGNTVLSWQQMVI